MAKHPKPKPKGVSIYSLAEEFGVTAGTVSRALRNRPEISIETRRIIRNRASEIGFQMRNFETRTTNICVVIETVPGQRSLFSAYVDSVLDGVWRYCNQRGVELSLFGDNLERLNSCDLVRVLGRRGVNGAVFLNTTKESRYFAALNTQNFPYCCVMTSPSEARQWTIRSNAQGLGERATEHLIHLGHRRIAFLDTLHGLDIGIERRTGYCDALKKAGVPQDPGLIVTNEMLGGGAADDFEFASLAVQAVTNRKQPPTAFLTMSDEAGVATLHELQARGIAVPTNASVITFDDSRLCAYVNPPLTVVSVPYERIGYDAAAIVHRRLEENVSQNLNPTLTVGGDLILRGSTGPAPNE